MFAQQSLPDSIITLTPEMAGTSNGYDAVVDMQVHRAISPAGQHQPVIAGLLQLSGKKTS